MVDDVGAKTPLPEREACQVDIDGGHILHDAGLCPFPGNDFFESVHWRSQDAIVNESHGRAPVFIFRYQGHEFVLRHYHRGGWIARVSQDRYIWTGLEQTRAWLEWRLLDRMQRMSLPVPRPVAARVLRHGLFYSADLVTEYLPGTRTLADRLADGALPEAVWYQIGSVIRRFHLHRIYHADLNARNILLDDEGSVFLVDFDKGYQGESGSGAQRGNITRLLRSLNRFKINQQSFHFDQVCWRWLLEGYRAG